MHTMKLPYVPLGLVLCVLFCGCDAVQDVMPIVSHEKRQKELEQQEETARAVAMQKEAQRRDGERQALAQHLASVSKSLSDEAALREEDNRRVIADRDVLTARLKALSSPANGKSRPARHEVLSKVLCDDAVNSLATRYLGRDFRMAWLAFEESVRKTIEHRSQLDRDKTRINEEYERAVKASREEGERIRTASREMLARQAEQIAKLETQRLELQRSLAMLSALERRKRENELATLENLLHRLKASFADGRAGREMSQDLRTASLHAEREQRSADQRRKDGEDRIRRAYATQEDVSDVSDRCERDTVVALERALEESARATSAALQGLRRAQSYVGSASAGLATLDSAALERLRKDVDDFVSRTLSGK